MGELLELVGDLFELFWELLELCGELIALFWSCWGRYGVVRVPLVFVLVVLAIVCVVLGRVERDIWRQGAEQESQGISGIRMGRHT